MDAESESQIAFFNEKKNTETAGSYQKERTGSYNCFCISGNFWAHI